MSDAEIAVLMIDDERSDARIVQRYLEEVPDRDVAFTHAETGEEGLKKLDQVSFDIVLVDYVLSENTGLDVVGRIRSSGYEGPLLMVTGKSWRLASEAIGHGADACLKKKELSSEKLSEEISHVLDKKKEQEEEKEVKSSGWDPTDRTSELFNRSFFLDLLREKVRDAILKNHSISLVFFRVPDFDEIGRLYGEDNRTRAVQKLAHIMDEHMEITDTAGRYADNIFVMVMPHKKEIEVREVAFGIQKKLADKKFETKEDTAFRLMLDCGMSRIDEEEIGDFTEDEVLVELINRAGKALLLARISPENDPVWHRNIEAREDLFESAQ